MNHFSFMRILFNVLIAVIWFVAPVKSYAIDSDKATPTVSTKWRMDLAHGYMLLLLKNNGQQPIRICSTGHFYSGADGNVLDLKNLVGPWSSKDNESVIYPIIMFLAKPKNSGLSDFIGDRGGHVLPPIVIEPGEEKSIKYSWIPMFGDLAKQSDAITFYLLYNDQILSSTKAKHGEGNLLNMNTGSGNP